MKKILAQWPHALASIAGITMIYKFYQVNTPDYMGFGAGILAIIGGITGHTFMANKSQQDNQQ